MNPSPPPFAVVIPARFGATRLPGKPLIEIAGQPLIRHVWECARRSQARQVVIATDDPRIARVARDFGAEVVMTATHHRSGTERIAEASVHCGWPDELLLVNLQGDEPCMPPMLIDQVATLLGAEPRGDIATLSAPLTDARDWRNPNMVKIVTDQQGRALYFSRAPIPWPRDGGAEPSPPAGCVRHLGLYAYRAGFVRRFVQWPEAPYERLEALEQLRALWHGAWIQVAPALVPPGPGVDTPDDIARVLAYWRQTPP